MPQDYRKLEVWQVSHQNALRLYRETQSFPAEERFGLTSQIRRAGSSVPTNIAEGCGRGAKKELRRFVIIAQGSNSEAEYLIQLAHELGFLERTTAVELHQELTKSGKMLNRYAEWLKQT